MRSDGSMYLLLIPLGLLAGCGDPVERHVQDVMAGGERRGEAIMELLMTKADALPVILKVLSDTDQPGPGRADLVELLGRIYMRESDARVLPVLKTLINDPAVQVRAAVAKALTRIGKKEAVHPLLERLTVEQDEEVQLQLLIALEILDEWGVSIRGPFVVFGGETLTPEEKAQFTELIIPIYKTASMDTLRQVAEEFYEKIVGLIVQDADRLVLKADLMGAEAKYQEALALKPDSKNAILRYGRFLFFEGDRQRGLDLLEENGMVLHVPRLQQVPVLDGDLSESSWTQAAKADRFYQTLMGLRVWRAQSRTEAYVGYTDGRLWVATKGYEEDTRILLTRYKDRDGSVWFDDSVAFWFDTNLDQRTRYRTFVNSAGTIADVIIGIVVVHSGSEWNHVWDGEQKVATRVEPTYWTMEMEIPFKPMGFEQVEKGDTWIFNMARIRAGSGVVPIMWTPTYGLIGRMSRFGFLVFD